MPAILLGIDATTFELQPERSIQVDKNGQVVLSDTYRGAKDDMISLAPAIQAAHPTYGFLKCTGVSYDDEEGGIAAMKITYKGSDTSGEFGASSADIETITISTTVAEEPLLSHPKLKDVPEAEMIALQQIINGSVTKDDGTEWADDITDDNAVLFLEKIRTGLVAYFVPSVELTISGTSNNSQESEIADVGTVTNPPGFTSIAGRTWLFLGLQQTQEGDVYRYEKSWRLSGPGGWDSDIYDYPTP